MIELYPFQRQIVAQVLADWEAYDRLLVQSPTGTGKTIMMLALADHLLRKYPDCRVAGLAHSDELVFQPIEKAQQFFPAVAAQSGVIKADRNDTDARFTMLSVMTLAREGRRDQLPQFDFILDDECHRSIGKTRYNLLTDTFANAKVAGFTAWPRRTDKVGLGHVYEHLSWRWTLFDAIEQGFLVPFTPLGFTLPVSFRDVKQRKDGSFDDSQAASLMDADNIIEIIYKKWVEHGGERKTIGFAPSVQMARRMAEYFSARGHNAAWVSGETPKHERQAILSSFESGDQGSVQVVFNRFVLTEGYDNPRASCLIDAAPTGSSLVAVQRLGRVLRLFEGKSDAVVLNFCPTNARLTLPEDVLSGEDLDKREARERAEAAGVLIFDMKPSKPGVGVINPDAVVVEVLNYATRSRLPWSSTGNSTVATVGSFDQLILAHPDEHALKRIADARKNGKWTERMALAERVLKKFRLYRARKIGVNDNGHGGRWVTQLVALYDSAKEAGTDITANTRGVGDSLGERSATWRKAPVTDNQVRFMERLGIDKDLVASIVADKERGKGRASRAIDSAVAAGRQRAAEQETLRAIYNGGAKNIADLVVGWEEIDHER